MNCKKAEGQLQPLFDGELGDRESAQVRKHFETCASCVGRYETLRLVALALKTLPLYSVSPAFNQKVLAALGHPAGRAALPKWMKGAVASFLPLLSGWMIFLLSVGTSTLSLLRIIQALEFLLHPPRLGGLLELVLAKAGLALVHFVPLWYEMRVRWGFHFPGERWGVQIILSSLLAGVLIFAFSKNAPSKETRRFA